MVIKIGVELEGNFIDENGSLSNRASEVVGSLENNGNILGELSRSMWEVISEPSEDMEVLYSRFRNELFKLRNITEGLNLGVVPCSTLNNESGVESRDFERPRGMRKRKVLGDNLRDLEHHLSGTHIHADILEDEEKAYAQYVLFQAADPVHSLMSSSPFLFGRNTLNGYRVLSYRNEVFRDMPLQGQLLGYPKSLKGAYERQKQSYREFLEILEEKGLDAEGIHELDCIWGPLRLTKLGTIESRCADANKLSNVMALASLYKGISEFVEAEDLNVEIDEKDNYDVSELFIPSNGRLIVPSYNRLKHFETVGARTGIKDEGLRRYLMNVIDTASKGLEDDSYLNPFLKMIDDGENFADDIVNYAEINGLEIDGRIDGNASKQIRRYIAEEYQKDLEVVR